MIINVPTSISMELGKKYKFVVKDGTVREVVVRGSTADDKLEIEVDGKSRKYSGLDKAIGEYISFSEA